MTDQAQCSTSADGAQETSLRGSPEPPVVDLAWWERIGVDVMEAAALEDWEGIRATGQYGYLSNLWGCNVIFDGRMFTSAERAYQFGKAADPMVAEWIEQAPTATLCAQAAHALLPWQVRPDWSTIKVDRMRAVLAAKFEQNPDLAAKLAATGGVRLIEESATDAFWGTGRRGTGQNILGILLEELREKIQGGVLSVP